MKMQKKTHLSQVHP